MFKRLILLVLVVLIFSELVVYGGEAPVMQWHKAHGTDNGNHVHYGLQANGGGYITAGQTSEARRVFLICSL